MTRKSNLTRLVINITQQNSRVAAVISAPQARSATENFETVLRMMHAPKGSAVKPGDTIKDGDNFYVLQYFNITIKDLVFRMFLTQEHGSVTRKIVVKDAVTGYEMSEQDEVFPNVYYGLESRNDKPDVGNFDRNSYRIITGFPLEVGDKLSGIYRIASVRSDHGVYYAEATK